jgi:hypothetical protein
MDQVVGCEGWARYEPEVGEWLGARTVIGIE